MQALDEEDRNEEQGRPQDRDAEGHQTQPPAISGAVGPRDQSFTDPDKAEVLRFAVDLLHNDYCDPRDLGHTYGKRATKVQDHAALSDDKTFRAVAELYLSTLDVTPGYLRRFHRTLETHAYPILGDTHINDIGVDVVGVVARRSKLEPTSRRRLVSGLLSPIFNYAIDREWRTRANPCRAISKSINPRPTMQPTLELRDAPMLLGHCYDVSELVGDFASTLFGTGLRWQEASTLTVESVDLERRVLRILSVEREGEYGKRELATNRGKSDSGFRDVPLPKQDNDPLIIILQQRANNRDPQEWLFTAGRGGRIYRQLIRKGFADAQAAAYVSSRYSTRITPHTFRRGFAQAVQDRGASADQIKRLLGHVRFTGATARYAYDRLTNTQVAELQPFVANLTSTTRAARSTQRLE